MWPRFPFCQDKIKELQKWVIYIITIPCNHFTSHLCRPWWSEQTDMSFPRNQTDRLFPPFPCEHLVDRVSWYGGGLRGLLRAPSSPLHLPLAPLPVSTSTAPPREPYWSLGCHSITVTRGVLVRPPRFHSLCYHNTFGLEWHTDTTVLWFRVWGCSDKAGGWRSTISWLITQPPTTHPTPTTTFSHNIPSVLFCCGKYQ